MYHTLWIYDVCIQRTSQTTSKMQKHPNKTFTRCLWPPTGKESMWARLRAKHHIVLADTMCFLLLSTKTTLWVRHESFYLVLENIWPKVRSFVDCQLSLKQMLSMQTGLIWSSEVRCVTDLHLRSLSRILPYLMLGLLLIVGKWCVYRYCKEEPSISWINQLLKLT